MASAIETLKQRLEALPDRNFECSFHFDPTDFMTKEQYDKLKGPVGYYGPTDRSGVIGPGVNPSAEEIEEERKRQAKYEELRQQRKVLIFRVHLPYSNRVMDHYSKFIKTLHRSDLMVFQSCSVIKDKVLLKSEVSHEEPIKTQWYDQIKAIVEANGQEISNYEKMCGGYDSDNGAWCEGNPLLFSGRKKVIDQEAEYAPESVILNIKIPQYLSADQLFLTPEKINWLVEQLSYT